MNQNNPHELPEDALAGAAMLARANSIYLGALYADDWESRARETKQAETMQRQAYDLLARVSADTARKAVECEREKIQEDRQLASGLKFDESKFSEAKNRIA